MHRIMKSNPWFEWRVPQRDRELWTCTKTQHLLRAFKTALWSPSSSSVLELYLIHWESGRVAHCHFPSTTSELITIKGESTPVQHGWHVHVNVTVKNNIMSSVFVWKTLFCWILMFWIKLMYVSLQIISFLKSPFLFVKIVGTWGKQDRKLMQKRQKRLFCQL